MERISIQSPQGTSKLHIIRIPVLSDRLALLREIVRKCSVAPRFRSLALAAAGEIDDGRDLDTPCALP